MDAAARRILDTVLALRNEFPGDSPDAETSADFHLDKIKGFLRRREPVTLVLPAFPAKSSNPEKTLGILPDYGEVLALQRLNQLCIEVGRIHAAGARLIVCSDGRVFSDLVQVTDEAVTQYGIGIRRIIRDYGLGLLSTYGLDDAFPDCAGYEEMRSRLVAEYAAPLAALRERVLHDAGAQNLFNGIHRFLFEDIVVLMPHLSRTRVRAWSKELAYATIQRSNAWSGLVERTFPEALRLSIHPQPANSRKIGVRLLPSDNVWRTPWHSAVLFEDGRHSLVRRREAEERRAVLVKADGLYPYFMMPTREAYAPVFS